jgi:hypothetical protein
MLTCINLFITITTTIHVKTALDFCSALFRLSAAINDVSKAAVMMHINIDDLSPKACSKTAPTFHVTRKKLYAIIDVDNMKKKEILKAIIYEEM